MGRVCEVIADQLQTSLHALFEKLRRLKTVELPRAEAMEPVERAYREERIRGAIRQVEEKIERRMKEMRSSMIEQTENEIILQVKEGKCEPQMSKNEQSCFESYIDENGNIRCGIRGGENG